MSKACPPRPDEPAEKLGGPTGGATSLARRAPLSVREAEPGSGSTLRRKAGRPGSGSTFKKQGGTTKRVRPGGADAAAAWRQAAFERVAAEHGRLVDEVTGENLLPDAQVHHWLEVGDLFTRRVAEYVVDGHPLIWHPANACVLNRRTHERHHNRTAPIPFHMVPEAVHRLARLLDEHAGDGWWAARLLSDYPDRGGA